MLKNRRVSYETRREAKKENKKNNIIMSRRKDSRQRRAKPVTQQRLYIFCRRLFSELIEIVKQMPRTVKYDFGLRIENLAFELTVCVSEAYHAETVCEKLRHLREFAVKYTSLELLLHLVDEKGWVRQPKRFGVVIEYMASINDQSRAWRASLVKKLEEAEGVRDEAPPESATETKKSVCPSE